MPSLRAARLFLQPARASPFSRSSLTHSQLQLLLRPHPHSHPRPLSSSTPAMGKPIIVCGAREAIGGPIIEGLKPEYDVIQFVMSADSGAVQIPAILRGEAPPTSDSTLGTHDYSRKPIAVVVGGAFSDAEVEQMFGAAKGIHPVPWLRVDQSIPAPPVGPEYGKALIARIKAKLPELEREGRMAEEGVVGY